MTRLLLSALLLFAVAASATPMMAPPERRVLITPLGDVLEWQPGLGIVVLQSGRTRTVTRITKRRVVTSEAKTVVPVERLERKPLPQDEADRIMEDLERFD